MSAQPEAINFGTGPVEGKLKDRFLNVVDPRKDPFTLRKTVIAVLAEFICTALFVLYCAGTVVLANYEQDNETLIPALGQGFSLALLIYIAAPASGGHLNPAVTIGTLCVGRITLIRAIFYVIAQYAGAIVGAALIKAFIRDAYEDNLGASFVNPDISTAGAFFFEFVMTFFLVFVMFSTAIDPRGVGRLAPLAIGMVVLCDNLIGGKWTGASMNPARTFGPALVSDSFDHYWLYFLAPVSGAVMAAVLYDFYLLIDPVNEAVDQNNNIIRPKLAVKNVDMAPPEYKPGFKKRHFWRVSSKDLGNNAARPPTLNQVKRSESAPLTDIIKEPLSAPVS